jgi:hypothetical protein
MSVVPISLNQVISAGNSKRSICMLFDQKEEARIILCQYFHQLKLPGSFYNRKQYLYTLSLITDEVIGLLTPNLSHKVGANSEVDQHEEKLVQCAVM